MMNRILKIISNDRIKNNFVYIPQEIASIIENDLTQDDLLQIRVVKIRKLDSDGNIYLGYMGGISSKDNSIELSSKLCECLSLKNGEYIKFSFESELNNDCVHIASLRLTPLSNYDYKLVEINYEFFEENLLNQLIIVYDKLIFPFTFFDNKVAYFKIDLDKKDRAFILSQDCEINIAFIPEENEQEEVADKKKIKILVY